MWMWAATRTTTSASRYSRSTPAPEHRASAAAAFSRSEAAATPQTAMRMGETLRHREIAGEPRQNDRGGKIEPGAPEVEKGERAGQDEQRQRKRRNPCRQRRRELDGRRGAGAERERTRMDS